MAKKQKITWHGSVITVEYPTIGKRVSTDISKHAQAVQLAALQHGYKQVYGDSASGGTPQEKYEMTVRRVAAHEGGSWELTDKDQDLTIVMEAVARVQGRDFDEVEEEFETKYKTEEKIDARLKELRANPKVKAEIAKIRAERAEKAAGDSTDEVEV